MIRWKNIKLILSIWISAIKNPSGSKNDFPRSARSAEYGYDLEGGPVPVVPVAHYTCGGVFSDLRARTSLPRLRAVGEVSCTGLHGANRLASTSLLECVVWGALAAEDIIRGIQTPFNPPEFFPGSTSINMKIWRLFIRIGRP